MNLHIERIEARHDRKSFHCGKRSMDDFLLDRGLSEAYGTTWVVVPEPGSSEIIAYFTIQPDPVDMIAEDEPDEQYTTIILERLAVDHRYQRQGIGRRILARLIRLIVQAAERYPLDALLLIPLDDEAKTYYLSLDFGFEEFVSDSDYLALPIETMRQAVALASAPSDNGSQT